MNYSPLILATLIVYVSLLATGVQPAAASNNVQSYMDTEPQSQPQARPLSGAVIRSGPLQGGIKSETSINPSLRVTPVAALSLIHI